MKYHIVEAKYIKNYIILLIFKDGLEGAMDFSNEFDGPIFEPLKILNITSLLLFKVILLVGIMGQILHQNIFIRL